MDFMKEYQKWLDSDVLTGEEKAELKAIANDPKEIESRFYGPLDSIFASKLSVSVLVA